MRTGVPLYLILLSFLISDFASAKAASSDQFYTFYGDVTAVDLAARTITIKSGGKRLVFRITDETKISAGNHYISWDNVKPGYGATVMMKLGEGNVGVALRIRFDTLGSFSKSLKLFAARTVSGGVVSGIAINNFVAYQPPADGWTGGQNLGPYHAGAFLMVVQRDGSVANVKMIESLGHNELNIRAIKWLKKWRFHPNSVTEVQMPVSYSQTR